MTNTISGSGSISGSGNINGTSGGGGGGAEGTIIANGKTIGYLRFDGGMMSDEVQFNIYSDSQTTYPMWNDYTDSMGAAIQSAMDNNQSLQVTVSGLTDETRDGQVIPFSWFNGVHPITAEFYNYSNDASFRLFFGNKNALNIPNLPNLNNLTKESTSGVTWAISTI